MSQEMIILILLFFAWVIYTNNTRSKYKAVPSNRKSVKGLRKFIEDMNKAYPSIKVGDIVPSLNEDNYFYNCEGFNKHNNPIWRRLYKQPIN